MVAAASVLASVTEKVVVLAAIGRVLILSCTQGNLEKIMWQLTLAVPFHKFPMDSCT